MERVAQVTCSLIRLRDYEELWLPPPQRDAQTAPQASVEWIRTATGLHGEASYLTAWNAPFLAEKEATLEDMRLEEQAALGEIELSSDRAPTDAVIRAPRPDH